MADVLPADNLRRSTRSSVGSTSSRSSKRRSVVRVSKPGLNYGFPDTKLYRTARLKVLEREKELEHVTELPGAHKFQREREGDYKTVKCYHYLHGKVYDLRPFYKFHPGGSDILRMSAGLPDATALFESYHAFADRDGIKEKLQKYLVVEDEEAVERAPAPLYTFEEGGFYDVLTKRVRKQFGATNEAMNESVTPNVKANKTWALKVGTQVFVNLLCYSLAFFARLPTPVAMIFAFIAGWFQIQWGFTAFHDASHFAIGARNHWANNTITRVWAAFSMWHGRIWMSHHVALHHQYTGSPSLDPDVQHATPMVRKSPDTPEWKVSDLFQKMGDKYGLRGYAAMATLVYAFLPGMSIGQTRVYLYHRLSKFKNMPSFIKKTERLWGMPKYKDLKGYETKWYEYAILGAQALVLLARLNPLVVGAYFVSLNIFYAMCIVADHDLVESAITNHVDFEPVHMHHDGHGTQAPSRTGEDVDRCPDWGEMQVRNTTNFANSRLNIFGNQMGNINFQIEHHLFPGMSHVFLPTIAPLVRDTCKEFDIPYTTYPSLTDAWYSFLIMLKAVMTKKDTDPTEVAKIKRVK